MFSASDSILARVPPCAMHRLSAVSQSVLSVKSCHEEFESRIINILNSHPETFGSRHSPASWAGVGGAWDALKRIGFRARYWRTFEQ